jgi:hypothetical protein
MNMLKERIIGFDCRLANNSRHEEYKDYELLWNIETNVKRLESFGIRLSIMTDVWDSVFMRYPYDFDERSAFKMEAPDRYYRTQDYYWYDLELMTLYLDEHFHSKHHECWIIAITVIENGIDIQLSYPKPDVTELGLKIVPLGPNLVRGYVISPEWTFLGYDVQNGSPDMRYGLGCISSESVMMTELSERWGPHLNTHQLFANQTVALEFARYVDDILPDVAPFFAYGLYKLGSYP